MQETTTIMTTLRTLLLGAITLIIGFGVEGCKKDENKPKGDYTLLTQHKWKISASKMIAEDGTESYREIATCSADDIREFETTGKFNLIVGQQCNEMDTSRSGTWELRNYGKILHLYVEGTGYYDEQVEELSETTLRIRYKLIDNTIEETYAPVR